MRVEVVQVPLAGPLVLGPDAVLGIGEDHLGVGLREGLVRPDVPVAVRGVAAGAGVAEPRMAIGGVVHDEVDDDPHPSVLGRAHEGDEVAQRSESRVDGVEVGDVVSVVAVRARVERHEPEAPHADAGEVVEPLGQALEVAVTVAVRVEERLDVEAVHDAVLPPQVARSLAGHEVLVRSSGSTLAPNASMNASCVGPDVVEVDGVDAELEVLLQPGDVATQVRGDVDDARAPPPGRRCRAAASNCSGSSRFHAREESKTLLRHCSWAMASACSSSSAQDRWTCRCTGLPSPPPSRNAPMTSRSTSSGWLMVMSPSAQPPTVRAVAGAHGRADEHRWLGRQVPQPRPVDARPVRRASPPRRASSARMTSHALEQAPIRASPCRASGRR